MKQSIEKVDDNVIELRPALKIKDPPVTDNWLKELDEGTIFLASSSNKTVEYEEFTIISKSVNAVLISENLREGKLDASLTYWVNPVTFSSGRWLIEILRN